MLYINAYFARRSGGCWGGGDLGPSSLIWKRSLCHHLNYPPRHDMINKIPRDSKQDIW